jgi:hypothetical protein
MSDVAPGERSPTEEWVPAAAAQLLAEGARFGATFGAFARRPRAAAASWAGGSSDFMNPLGFVAFGAAVFWAVANGAAALWPVPGAGAEASIGNQIATAVGPQVHYGLLGLAMHGVLRALGSRRRMAASVGVSFYVGGSVGVVLALAMVVLGHYMVHAHGLVHTDVAEGGALTAALAGAAVVTYALLCVVLARAMIGLHGARGWQAAIAIAFAILLTALLFGSVLPEGSYGWHPYLSLSFPHDGGYVLGFGFRH